VGSSAATLSQTLGARCSKVSDTALACTVPGWKDYTLSLSDSGLDAVIIEPAESTSDTQVEKELRNTLGRPTKSNDNGVIWQLPHLQVIYLRSGSSLGRSITIGRPSTAGTQGSAPQPADEKVTLLRSRIGTAGGISIATGQNAKLSGVRVTKDTTKGTVTVDYTLNFDHLCIPCRFLLRLFDANGEYLVHFTSAPFFEMFGTPMPLEGTRTQQLTLRLNARDLQFVEAAEFGISD